MIIQRGQNKANFILQKKIVCAIRNGLVGGGMIIPFSELKLYIADFEGKYIPSFVNDLARESTPSRGLVLAEAGNKTLYVLISDGRAVISKVLAFSDEEDLVTDVPVNEILSEKSVDLYLFSISSDFVFTWLTDFFTYPVSLFAQGRFVDVMKRHIALRVHLLLGGQQYAQSRGRNVCELFKVEAQFCDAVQRRFEFLFQIGSGNGIQTPFQRKIRFVVFDCFGDGQHK